MNISITHIVSIATHCASDAMYANEWFIPTVLHTERVKWLTTYDTTNQTGLSSTATPPTQRGAGKHRMEGIKIDRYPTVIRLTLKERKLIKTYNEYVPVIRPTGQ